jgi:hypothetical protein
MKKTVLLIVAVIVGLLVIVGAWFVFFWQPGPSYKSVAYLESPEITTLSSEFMMTLTLTGNPDDIAGEGINALFSAWSQAGGQWNSDIAPRARWGAVDEFDGKTDTLTGTFGLPMPAGVTELPAGLDERIQLETWEYGTVAQILHVGSYDDEQPTVDRLRDYITGQGYVISGEHEEVYLKGPNMFGFGNEKNFLTIIRYPVTQ